MAGRALATLAAAVRAVFTAAPFDVTLNGEDIRASSELIDVDQESEQETGAIGIVLLL